MAANMGLTGTATITSAGYLAFDRSGRPASVRVFDVAVINTGTGAATHVRLMSGINTWSTIAMDTGIPYILLPQTFLKFNSNAGIRFPAPTGCFVTAGSCSAMINYIEEF